MANNRASVIRTVRDAQGNWLPDKFASPKYSFKRGDVVKFTSKYGIRVGFWQKYLPHGRSLVVVNGFKYYPYTKNLVQPD